MSNSGALPKSTTLRLAVGLVVAGAFALSACGGSALSPAAVKEANAKAQAGLSGGNGSLPTVQDPSGTSSTPPDGTTDPTVPNSPGQNPGTTGQDPGTTGQDPGTTGKGGTPAPPTGKGIVAGSCKGFKNTTGITDSTITIGNIADVSGPVPGIFTAAQYAVKAYAAYFNSTSNICGRKLAVQAYDSQTNTSGDAVATQKTCDDTFAAVGSMSAFDTGGTANAKACKIPEIHAIITNAQRSDDCSTCFGAEAPGGGYFADSIPDYFTKHNKAATQKAAMLYVNAAASVGGAKGQVAAETRRGWKFIYQTSFDIAEFNYGPYVQQLKSKGVKLVQMYGSADMAVRMAQAFQSANYKPDLFILNATQYDKNYAKAGSAVEGTILYIDFTPIEEMGSNPELALYNRWLQQISPGAQPTYFGLYAWSAARLFAEQATKLGGKLTRANLVTALRGVHSWTANNLHAPQDVGRKVATGCARFIQLHNGKWVPYGGTKYYCGGIVSAK